VPSAGQPGGSTLTKGTRSAKSTVINTNNPEPPSWQIRPLLDPVIPQEEFKFEADRAHSHVIEVNSSHAIPITYPDVVLDVIEQAARATAK
jgi:hypothetical protein